LPIGSTWVTFPAFPTAPPQPGTLGSPSTPIPLCHAFPHILTTQAHTTHGTSLPHTLHGLSFHLPAFRTVTLQATHTGGTWPGGATHIAPPLLPRMPTVLPHLRFMPLLTPSPHPHLTFPVPCPHCGLLQHFTGTSSLHSGTPGGTTLHAPHTRQHTGAGAHIAFSHFTAFTFVLGLHTSGTADFPVHPTAPPCLCLPGLNLSRWTCWFLPPLPSFPTFLPTWAPLPALPPHTATFRLCKHLPTTFLFYGTMAGAILPYHTIPMPLTHYTCLFSVPPSSSSPLPYLFYNNPPCYLHLRLHHTALNLPRLPILRTACAKCAVRAHITAAARRRRRRHCGAPACSCGLLLCCGVCGIPAYRERCRHQLTASAWDYTGRSACLLCPFLPSFTCLTFSTPQDTGYTYLAHPLTPRCARDPRPTMPTSYRARCPTAMTSLTHLPRISAGSLPCSRPLRTPGSHSPALRRIFACLPPLSYNST